VCADRCCGRGHRRHRANVATESYMAHTAPDYNRVHWRHGGPTPPLLCCGANVCRRNNDFCDAQTHIRPRAAGVSPPWFSEPHLQVQCDEHRRWNRGCGVHATGGLRRPALGRECERWANYAYSSCKFDRNIAAFGNAPSTHAYSICRLDTFTTGGLRPPLLVARRSFAVKSGICDEQTHVHKSGGREPAVALRTASASGTR
jgi:hypothetical protein